MRPAKSERGVRRMRMMAAFEKGEELRFIGHLDLMRTIQRALRRSHLPIRYSNGFNPHIRLSFAAPLSVGVAGRREWMEAPMEDGADPEEFMARMNGVLPPSLQIVYAKTIDDSFPTLMSLVAGSRYSIELPLGPETEKAATALEGFLALPEYVANRRTKSGENPCDIRPFVKEAALSVETDGYRLSLTTLCTAAGALKPSLWLKCLLEYAEAEPVEGLIWREETLTRNQKGELIPLEAYEYEPAL